MGSNGAMMLRMFENLTDDSYNQDKKRSQTITRVIAFSLCLQPTDNARVNFLTLLTLTINTSLIKQALRN